MINVYSFPYQYSNCVSNVVSCTHSITVAMANTTTAGTSRCFAAFFCFILYSSKELEQRYVRIDRIKNNGMWKEKINARTSLPVFPTSAVCPSIVARIAIPFAKSIHWTLPVFTAVFGSVLFKFMSPLSTPGRFGMLLSSKAFGTALLCSFDFRIRTDTFSQFHLP